MENADAVLCKDLQIFFCLIGDITVMVLGHKRSELHAL